MSTIVVRASDTALAMEEVKRRLGEEAYILSTKQKNGQVEIRATTEAPKPKPRPAPQFAAPQAKGRSFGEVFAEKTAATRPPLPDGLRMARRDVIDDVTQPSHPTMRPDVDAPNGGYPGLAPAFVADLWSELGQAPGDETGFFGNLCAAILPGKSVTTASRIILVGPSGAGKTSVAARLAALIMTERAGVYPLLVAPRAGRLLSPDFLAGASRLMGLTVDRPLLSDLAKGRAIPAPGLHAPQIMDLPDLPVAAVEALVEEHDDTQVILCLPSGLHPGMITRHASRWAALSPMVCLTKTDEWAPTPEELAAISASGLQMGLMGIGASLLDTLIRPTRADLRSIAEGWLTPVSRGRA